MNVQAIKAIRQKKISWSQQQIAVFLFLLISLSVSVMWASDIFMQGMGSPQTNIFFMRFGDYFADFTNVVGYSACDDVYNSTVYTGLGEKAYSPLCFLLLRPFANLVDIDSYIRNENFLDMYQEPLFLTFLIGWMFLILMITAAFLRKKLPGKGWQKDIAVLALMFNQPLVFTVERGNLLLLTVLFSIVFLFYYKDENAVKKEIALISLGLAFALKLSPAILGCLLLWNRQYKESFRAALYGLILLFGPFLLLENGFANIPLMFRNVKLNLAAYTSDTGCTLEALIRYFGAEMPSAAFSVLTYIVSGLLLIGGWFLQRDWERTAAAVLMLIIMPSHSGYYCVLYLLPVAVLFLSSDKFRSLDWFAWGGFLAVFLLWEPFLWWQDYHLGLIMLLLLLLTYECFGVIRFVTERLAAKGRTELLQSSVYQLASGTLRLSFRRKKSV